MSQARLLRSGFTLVEILIVVVILGILAAIVIPQYSDAANTAKANAMQSQIQAVRGQIELYHVHHNTYPTIDQLWGNLMTKTDAAGAVSPGGTFGPYLQQAPLNVYTNSSAVAALGAGAATDGWEYDAPTGQMRAVGFDEQNLTYTAP